MSFGVHLAADAVVAYVDRELPALPAQRAVAHLAVCAECRAAVAAQLATKSMVGETHEPLPSGDLLDRLRSIPMTTDLGRSELVLGVRGEELAEYVGPEPMLPAAESASGPPMSPPSVDTQAANRRLRRGLLGMAAGVAVGVLAATAPTTSGVSSSGSSGGSQPSVNGTTTGRSASLSGSLTTAGSERTSTGAWRFQPVVSSERGVRMIEVSGQSGRR